MGMLTGALVAGVMCGVLGASLMLYRAKRGMVPIDLPDERRMHTIPTPRGGGIGIVAAGVLGVGLAALADGAQTGDFRLVALVALLWALPNGIIGLLDDHGKVSWRLKLVVQLGAASAAVALGLRPPHLAWDGLLGVAAPAVDFVACVLWLAWMATTFNFMDGIDGMAAGSASVFFLGFASLAAASGHVAVAVLSVAMMGGAVGFLKFNLPPARIFMGDGGALFTGAVLGGLVLALARLEPQKFFAEVLILMVGPFAFDVSFTLVRRLLRKEPVVTGCRTHLYQRLVATGWSVGKTSLVYAALAACLGGITFLFASQGTAGRVALLAAAAIVLGGLLLGTVLLEKRAPRS